MKTNCSRSLAHLDGRREVTRSSQRQDKSGHLNKRSLRLDSEGGETERGKETEKERERLTRKKKLRKKERQTDKQTDKRERELLRRGREGD